MKPVGVLKVGLWVISVMLGTALQAQPVSETIDRVELNWSAMRIRFYGEATSNPNGMNFDLAEKAATEEGLLYALQSIPRVRGEKGLGGAADPQIAAELTRQTYVINTTYFADGRVRVDLEGNLPKALEGSASSFEKDEPQAAPSSASSIVLNISDLNKPLLSPEIVSSSGEVLFSSKNVARSAYRKNMSGRWYYQKSIELKNYVGAEPIALEARTQGDKLVIDADQWQKVATDHPRLIEEGRLAFALPALPKSKAGSRQ